MTNESVWIDPDGGLAYHKRNAQKACLTHGNHQYVLVTKQEATKKGYLPCPACYGKGR